MSVLYFETDDTKYGVKFVYCHSHDRVHNTGWCTVPLLEKVALVSQDEDQAKIEWEMKKSALGIKC